MNLNQTRFITSAATFNDCPEDSIVEIAFAGRSNAGKSSAINSVCNQTRLARTSKTPGRTQLLNFFAIEPNIYLVDLPGYGFAKVPLEIKNAWQQELEQYLREREQLAGIILLSDIRHPLKEFDRMMIDWAAKSSLPLHLLLTKSDKIKRGPARNALLKTRKELEELANVSVQLFSSVKNAGLSEVKNKIFEWTKINN